MNRRNFVVGLGTVATISGVASVTAASFADQVEPTADFQVIVDENLTLRYGDDVPSDDELDGDDGWTDESIEFEEQDVDFDEDGDGGVVVYADRNEDEDEENINDDIELEVAVANDSDEVSDTTYENFLLVENDGIEDYEIGITFEFGDDVDDGTVGEAEGGSDDGEIDAGDVVDLFRFEVDDDRISPEEGSVDEPDEFVTVDPDDDVDIDFIVDLDSDLEAQFAEEADVEDSLFSDDDGASDNFDLIDTLVVGVEDDEE